MTNLVLLVSDSAIHLMDFAPSASLLDLPLTTGKAEEFADLIRGLAHAYTSATPGALAEFLHQQWFDMQPDETDPRQGATMNIYARHGDRIVYAYPNNGTNHDKNVCCTHLQPGEVYTVDFCKVESFSTDVYLVEVPGVRFNSVMFADLRRDRELHEILHEVVNGNGNGKQPECATCLYRDLHDSMQPCRSCWGMNHIDGSRNGYVPAPSPALQRGDEPGGPTGSSEARRSPRPCC